MEKRNFLVLATALLVSILAAPSISSAANPIERIQESFDMGDSGCNMNIQLSEGGTSIVIATVYPANGVAPPPCVDDGEAGLTCPPEPCCVFDWDAEGNWYCASTQEVPVACTPCSRFNQETKIWSIDPTCSAGTPGGGGGASLPECVASGDVIEPRPISTLNCKDCTANPDGTYTCHPDNCEPLRFVETNTFEKSGDGSTYCYNSTAGTQVCKTCTTNPTTKKTTCVTK